jgi:hypothetical protein
VRLTSNPKSEIWMNFSIFREQNFFHFSHEFKTQMAVGEDNPFTCSHALIDKLHSWDFHLFSHRYLTSWELLLLFGELINGTGWIRSWRQKIKYRSIRSSFFIQISNLISDRKTVFFTHSGRDELSASKQGSIFSDRSDQAQVNEMTNILV